MPTVRAVTHDLLHQLGVTTVFCNPGEIVLDAAEKGAGQ